MMSKVTCAGLLIVLAALIAQAQIEDRKCNTPIYSASEVTWGAKILNGPDVSIIKRSVAPNARGTVVLNAVLCRTGQVTDIKIVKGLSAEVNEFTVAAVQLVTFTPAELKWHSVSQRMTFELHFGSNEPVIKITASPGPAGRLVDTVLIVGHRRLTTDQILSWIKTRPGEPYRFEQIEKDLTAMLATGQFDKEQTVVTIEDGVRGGVVVTFQVVEAPVIKQ